MPTKPTIYSKSQVDFTELLFKLNESPANRVTLTAESRTELSELAGYTSSALEDATAMLGYIEQALSEHRAHESFTRVVPDKSQLKVIGKLVREAEALKETMEQLDTCTEATLDQAGLKPLWHCDVLRHLYSILEACNVASSELANKENPAKASRGRPDHSGTKKRTIDALGMLFNRCHVHASENGLRDHKVNFIDAALMIIGVTLTEKEISSLIS